MPGRGAGRGGAHERGRARRRARSSRPPAREHAQRRPLGDRVRDLPRRRRPDVLERHRRSSSSAPGCRAPLPRRRRGTARRSAVPGRGRHRGPGRRPGDDQLARRSRRCPRRHRAGSGAGFVRRRWSTGRPCAGRWSGARGTCHAAYALISAELRQGGEAEGAGRSAVPGAFRTHTGAEGARLRQAARIPPPYPAAVCARPSSRPPRPRRATRARARPASAGPRGPRPSARARAAPPTAARRRSGTPGRAARAARVARRPARRPPAPRCRSGGRAARARPRIAARRPTRRRPAAAARSGTGGR